MNNSTAKLIAVGGAKGGIGKSLFVVNMGVLLSQMGKRAVVVDLDLGAANLHLYMGVWSLKRRIDDFLTKKVPTISDILIPTKYGPQLIGGGGARLGAANIHFSRKLKLMRSLKTIDADYIIMDMGGDTSYNVLDFYLAADQGFVLTTCDPASYLDAYGFIKLALHRKLTRLFGAESPYRRHRDFDLENLIKSFIFSTTGQNHQLRELLERIRNEYPVHHKFIREIIGRFRPATIVTMTEDSDQVDALVGRIKKVSRRMLSIDVDHFGCLPFEKGIQQSARELVPHLAKNPGSGFARALRRIALKMEMVQPR
jgi:flagellar biosynthesis protein FlhG